MDLEAVTAVTVIVAQTVREIHIILLAAQTRDLMPIIVGSNMKRVAFACHELFTSLNHHHRLTYPCDLPFSLLLQIPTRMVPMPMQTIMDPRTTTMEQDMLATHHPVAKFLRHIMVMPLERNELTCLPDCYSMHLE